MPRMFLTRSFHFNKNLNKKSRNGEICKIWKVYMSLAFEISGEGNSFFGF